MSTVGHPFSGSHDESDDHLETARRSAARGWRPGCKARSGKLRGTGGGSEEQVAQWTRGRRSGDETARGDCTNRGSKMRVWFENACMARFAAGAVLVRGRFNPSGRQQVRSRYFVVVGTYILAAAAATHFQCVHRAFSRPPARQGPFHRYDFRAVISLQILAACTAAEKTTAAASFFDVAYHGTCRRVLPAYGAPQSAPPPART